jgi:hypothetical protein
MRFASNYAGRMSSMVQIRNLPSHLQRQLKADPTQPVALSPLSCHTDSLGEGKDPIPSLSPRERGRRQRWDRCVQRESSALR